MWPTWSIEEWLTVCCCLQDILRRRRAFLMAMAEILRRRRAIIAGLHALPHPDPSVAGAHPHTIDEASFGGCTASS